MISHVTSAYLARYDVHFPEPEASWTPRQTDAFSDVLVVDELPEEVESEEHRQWEWVFGKTPKFVRKFEGGIEVVVDKGLVAGVSDERIKGAIGSQFNQTTIQSMLHN